MKNISILFFLVAALFTTTVFAEGNMGNGGRGINNDVKTEVKGGATTEDGDPPPPPQCVPTPENPCDDGNMGNGGRPDGSMLVLIQKYLISFYF